MFKKFIPKRFNSSEWFSQPDPTFDIPEGLFINQKDLNENGNQSIFTYDLPEFMKVARRVYEEEQRSTRLTKWILLAGPAYEKSKYKCSILIETKKLFVWAITFGKNINLQNENQLESARYLATQVINANNDDETVKFMDESLRVVLEPYLPSFLQQNYLTVFCCHCRKHDVEVKTINDAKDEEPKWACECGQSLCKEK
ncbi:hypothetical protein MCEMSE6_02249 [Oxalobacteraceae bacterium]